MKTALIYNPQIRNYSFGKGHPFTSDRFENFISFTKEKLSNFEDVFEQIMPESATDEDLKLFHSKEYVDVMEKASRGVVTSDILRYVTVDNLDPSAGDLPKGMHEAGKIAVGSSLKGAELVFKGKFKKAIVLGGGLHHAKREKGEGFCIYNDVVICAKKLLKKGLKKILILDTDAHAGNGTSEAFYEDSRVLFIDIHQDPRTIYPGTGFIHEIGTGKGEGFCVNIPLLPGAGDKSYEFIFKEVIFPIVKEFKPQIIIRNGGSDPHFADALTDLGLTLKGFRLIGEKVNQLSNEVCEGKEIDLLASGYNQKVLPLAWLSLVAGLLNLRVELKEPQEKSLEFPMKDFRLKETKKTVKELKSYLSKHWKCF